MVLQSCLQSSHPGAEVSGSTKNIDSHSKALPITMLVIGTLTVLVAALIGIPGLLSTTSSLNLPSSFAWIHAIGTPGLAAILGTGGAVGLSVIAFSSRRLCQAKYAETLASDQVEGKHASTSANASSSAQYTTAADALCEHWKTITAQTTNEIQIEPLKDWQQLTNDNCRQIVGFNSIETFHDYYRNLQPGNFVLLIDPDGRPFAVANKQQLVYSKPIEEKNGLTDTQKDALSLQELLDNAHKTHAKIGIILTDSPFNLTPYVRRL